MGPGKHATKGILGAGFIFFLLASCASLAGPDYEKPPALENRTLRISASIAGFEYQWKECVKRGLFGRCREWEMKKESYDLTDAKVRERLILMGFVARVKEKVLP
jgi:hypothetical protein